MSAHAEQGPGVPGLVVLFGIVAIGIGSGAAYFHYKAPRLRADLESQLAKAPVTPEGRLEAWHLHGGPQVHHRLTNFGRWSDEYPWIVTHAIQREEGELELHGVVCDAIEPGALTHVEGMRIVVQLPAPDVLGRARLSAEELAHVPVYADDSSVPDPALRLEQLCRGLLSGLPAALERDIPGARLEFRIGSTQAGEGGEPKTESTGGL